MVLESFYFFKTKMNTTHSLLLPKNNFKFEKQKEKEVMEFVIYEFHRMEQHIVCNLYAAPKYSNLELNVLTSRKQDQSTSNEIRTSDIIVLDKCRGSKFQIDCFATCIFYFTKSIPKVKHRHTSWEKDPIIRSLGVKMV